MTLDVNIKLSGVLQMCYREVKRKPEITTIQQSWRSIDKYCPWEPIEQVLHLWHDAWPMPNLFLLVLTRCFVSCTSLNTSRTTIIKCHNEKLREGSRLEQALEPPFIVHDIIHRNSCRMRKMEFKEMIWTTWLLTTLTSHSKRKAFRGLHHK